ncbi:ubiquitin carboxyl-terminal hydrolase 16-like, partial [Trifolium medium]|nr:ubiquitin carboxyl-terminal hydrolase 16-like [Trifolium medium]
YGAGSYNDSLFNFNPSVAARKSFDDNRHETHDTFTKPVHDNTADDTCVASTDSDETVLPTSLPLESKNPVNIEVKNCSSSKRSKKKSSNNSDESGFKSKVPKVKFDTSHDAASNLVGHEHKRKVESVEKSVADTSKGRAVPSSSNSNKDVAADYVEDSYLSRYKEGRRSSSSSRDRLLSTAKEDLISHSMSTKTENYHALPSKFSVAPNPPQNIRSGLKTSMQKVVQQFRSSKESKSNQMSVENEVVNILDLFI